MVYTKKFKCSGKKIPDYILKKESPRTINLITEIGNQQITINQMKKIIAERERKNRNYLSIMHQMDSVIHVIMKNTSNIFIQYSLLLFSNDKRENKRRSTRRI